LAFDLVFAVERLTYEVRKIHRKRRVRQRLMFTSGRVIRLSVPLRY
jgi:hypothetical protein